MKNIVIVGFVALWSMSMNCHATSGNDLLNSCSELLRIFDKQEETNYGEARFCMGILEGITRYNAYLNGMNETNGAFCLDKNVTMEQVVRIVVKELQDNPKNLHRDATGLIGLAMTRSFPCPNMEK